MFRGSPALSAGQLAEIAAGMGGEFDADTQQTVTQYFFTVPSEDLDLALHVEAIRMQGVLDTDQLWDKERGAIEQEVAQDLSNPEYVFYSRLLASVFKGTPYADDALGTRPSFDKTTGAMLKKFYDAWYAARITRSWSWSETFNRNRYSPRSRRCSAASRQGSSRHSRRSGCNR